MTGKDFRVEVKLERRDDGGLRAYSDDVPGLVLSSDDLPGLLRDVPVVLSACLSHTFGHPVTVAPLTDLGDYLAGSADEPDRGTPGRRQFVAHA